MPAAISPSALGSQLRWMRKQAGLSGPGLATIIGVSQTAVSRWETGARGPAAEAVAAWRDACLVAIADRLSDDELSVRIHRELAEAHATIASPDYLLSLTRLADDASTEVVSNFVITRTGLAQRQQELGELEARARRIRHFQPLICPGQLQTADYARLIMSGSGLVNAEEAKAAADQRLERSRRLQEPGAAAYHVIITESALSLQLAGAEPGTRAGLLRNMRTAADLPHFTIQIIPSARPFTLVPLGPFLIYELTDDDDPLVLVETYAAQITFVAARDVTQHDEAWSRLLRTALSPGASIAWIDSQLRS